MTETMMHLLKISLVFLIVDTSCGSGIRLTALWGPATITDSLTQSPLREHSWSRERLVKETFLHSNLSGEPSESRESLKPSLSSFLFLSLIRLQESVRCLVTSRLRVRWSFPRESHRGRSRWMVYSMRMRQDIIPITWLWYNKDILSISVHVRGACLWNWLGKNGKRKL